MLTRIEDYALIGDLHTAAIVSREGSIDWLCLPRFDSPACFASLLGTSQHGRWLLRPAGQIRNTERRYRDRTLVLETQYETAEGSVVVTDCMPLRERHPNVVRLVEGKAGTVPMHMEMIVRFYYGSIMPWVKKAPAHEAHGQADHSLIATAGPNAVCLRTAVDLCHDQEKITANFCVSPEDVISFVLTSYAAHESLPAALDAMKAIETTEQWWRDWSARCTYRGPWKDAVIRSLITLKALIHAPTGGMLAAATTSLSESLRGCLNWDYRFCWLRDASLSLKALLDSGYDQEAQAWRKWIIRATAGDPADLQVVYGVTGERQLPETTLEWLPGYEGTGPAHIGNAAAEQCQLDIYGETINALSMILYKGIEPDPAAWSLQCAMLDYLESNWERPDHGIWETRGERKQYTYSKVMAWVAMDRAVKETECFGLEGPVERWRRLRDKIHETVCNEGYDSERRAFVQSFGSTKLDASLLMIPIVGFLPPDDPRVRSTVEAIERELMVDDGLLLRYGTKESPREGIFIACSFWLADNYALMGRQADAERLFERLLRLCNDVGLLSEEYHPRRRRLLGNFPQTLSHLSLINSAHLIERTRSAG
ncbi:glycoside hydrolase family 15 protein [Nitrospira sp. Nam74]